MVVLFLLLLDDNVGFRRRWEEFGINLGTHEQGSRGRAANQVEPDTSPAKGGLEGTHGQETNAGRDTAATIDQARDRTETLVVPTHRGVTGQIGGDGARDDIVGSVCVGL